MVVDDVVLDVPPESQVHRPVVRKSLDLTEVVLGPAIALAYIELPESVLGDAASMSDLVVAELLSAHGRTVNSRQFARSARLRDASSGIRRPRSANCSRLPACC